MKRLLKKLFVGRNEVQLDQIEIAIGKVQREMIKELQRGGDWKSDKMQQLDGQRKLLEGQLASGLAML